MKKLPIGLQDFARLRDEDYLYVDKTEFLYQLATQGKYYFLSRPRRFGKSLLVSTLSVFQGNQGLFKGLWIHDRWDWSETFPVLDFRFNKSGYKVSGLETFLYEELANRADAYGIQLTRSSYPAQLEELIVALAHYLSSLARIGHSLATAEAVLTLSVIKIVSIIERRTSPETCGSWE